MPEPIYKHVFTITVLTQGEDTADYYPTLDYLQYDITEGPCIGTFAKASGEAVSADEIERELLALGNDGTFFDDD